ncbi:MAG: class I SAM-dependent methyltransferase [Acidimicrobiales bacterium]
MTGPVTPSDDPALRADLDDVRRTWSRLAEVDPLWAVLSDPGKEGGRWKTDEFFARGEEEIAGVIAQLDGLGVPVTFGTCLDFGCGVGRLTQALSRRFAEAHGVDIAEPMIEQARRYNRAGDRCHYHVNTDPDLRRFTDATFDFVYSNIVLQHMPPAASTVYMRELVRVLRPGGVAVFQVPSERVAPPLQPGQTRGEDAMLGICYRATIELLHGRRLAPIRPGATRTVRVLAGNAGPYPWPTARTADGRFAVRLGNQWLGEDGTVLNKDDGRVDFAADIQPDQLVKAAIRVTAPDRPGRYRLVIDFVHEGVGWFGDRGSPPLTVLVRVMGPAVRSADRPEFEMHAVPRAEVEAVLGQAGADVVAVLEDHCAGPSWLSHRYVATKRPS